MKAKSLKSMANELADELEDVLDGKFASLIEKIDGSSIEKARLRWTIIDEQTGKNLL